MARGKGEGSVYRRADGYWVGAVEVGRYPNGKRRKARVVRRYKADVLEEMDKLRAAARDGVIPDRTKTLATYLRYWLTDVIAGSVSDVTYKEYVRRIEQRIIPAIGHVRLGRLTKAHVQAMVNQLARDGLSPNSQRTVLSTLTQALSWAVGDLVPSNPAEHVQRPQDVKVKIDDALDEAQAKAVIRAAKGDPLYALFWLALKYGLRLGELLNLRWTDIDFEKGEMEVRKSKTAAGVRQLPLIPEAAEVLKAHRRGTVVHSLDGYVFAAPNGGKLHPQRVREAWSDVLAAAKVPHMCTRCGTDKDCSSAVRRFHSSRHTAATLLLEAGVPLEVVSAILGHADIQTTSTIYAKVRNDLKRKGLAKLA